MLQRDCTRARQQRQTKLGALALGLSEVSAATFQEWAVHSLASCAWAKDYYQQQRAKGKPGNTVVRALAFKWIRILFRCWKDRTPYCESTYLQGLERHQRFSSKGSPVKLQWKTSAGFRKIEAATS